MRHAPRFSFAVTRSLQSASAIRTTKFALSGYEYAFEQQFYNQEYLDHLIELADAMDQKAAAPKLGGVDAGYTYFGQFVAHDVTSMEIESGKATNRRRFRLALDSVFDYGNSVSELASCENASAIYKHIPVTILGNHNSCAYDLPRLKSGQAVIADRRNDDTLTLAQFQVLFIKLYNKICDICEVPPPKNGYYTIDQNARELCSLIFQAAIWDDYLPRLVDKQILERVKIDGAAVIQLQNRENCPIEMALAGFRFGHAMVRGQYEWWNRGHNSASVRSFWNNSFNSKLSSQGFTRLDFDWVTNWTRLFDMKSEEGCSSDQVLKARTINASLTGELQDLRDEAIDHEGPHSLALRTLARAVEFGVQPWEIVLDCANRRLGGKLRIDPIDPAVDETQCVRHALKEIGSRVPLWFYLLKEAELKGCFGGLGPLGGTLLAETLEIATRNSSPNIFAEGSRQKIKDLIGFEHLSLPRIIEFVGEPNPMNGCIGEN